MLEPIFGESGSIIALYLVLFILLLGLIWLGYWLFRYYGGGALGSAGKGRGPRLGVVDSLSIDHRHKLVLVRRDNVEHLILIGKTADLVVEPSILRTAPASPRARPSQAPRQQAQRQEGVQPAPPAQNRPASPVQAPAPPPTRPGETGISEPIPVPARSQARVAQQIPDRAPPPVRPPDTSAESAPRRAVRRDGPRASAFAPPTVAEGNATASAHFEEPARPTRIDSAVLLDDTGGGVAGQAVARMNSANRRHAPSANPEGPAPEPHLEEVAVQVPYNPVTPDSETSSERAAPAAAIAEAESSDRSDARGDSATKVSSLEQEMAKLLGEITSKRGG